MPLIDDQPNDQYDLHYAYWNSIHICNPQRSGQCFLNDVQTPSCRYGFAIKRKTNNKTSDCKGDYTAYEQEYFQILLNDLYFKRPDQYDQEYYEKPY